MRKFLKFLLFTFPQPLPLIFYKGNLHWVKSNTQNVFNTGAEQSLIVRDHKTLCSPPAKVGVFEGEVINTVCTKVQLTVSTVVPQTHPMFILPVPEYINKIDGTNLTLVS